MKKVYDYETAMVDISYRRKKKSPRKTAILKSAVKHFSEKGFDETSIKDIVDDAKCSIHAVNYYYGSKAALWSEVIDYLAAKHFRLEDLLKPHEEEKFSAQALNKLIHTIFLYTFSEKNLTFSFQLPSIVSHDYEPALFILYRKYDVLENFFLKYLASLGKDEEKMHQVSHLIWNNICAVTLSYKVINGPKIDLKNLHEEIIRWSFFTTQSSCYILGIDQPKELTKKELENVTKEANL
ncbi:MAG: TetR/AcrR family transcriptional regulator [Candidatus Cloacimonetes bacterium]|nr:TetR/AcrR family transcriptional regulator [Candidatus Cloacimonadota bacterium]